MTLASEITGVILCGGAGSRLGGVEKPLALVDSSPLVAHVRTRLAPQVASIVISANRAHDAYAAWGDVVVGDAIPAQGPLGGLLTAMDCVSTPYTFCCPGDAPFVSRRLVSALAGALQSSTARGAIPHDGERAQQLFLLVETSCRHDLRDYLAAGGRAVLGWLDRIPMVVVDVSAEHDTFLNVNTPTELQAASRRLALDLEQ